jgi:hypothetical protein
VRAVPLLFLVLATTSARADGDDLVSRPLVLDRGQLEAALTAEANLSVDQHWNPSALAPDVWYGLTDRLTIGVVHSGNALSQLDITDGWCFRGAEHGCGEAYTNLGVDARWSLAHGDVSAAARVRLVTRRWDPWLPSARVGALVRWQRGRFAITSDPQLQIGLLHTDQGNRLAFNVPVWLAVQPTCRWMLYLHTGPHGDLAVLRDGWGAPVAAGVRVAITPHIDVAAEAGFTRLLGPLNEGKLRAGWIGIDVRWP